MQKHLDYLPEHGVLRARIFGTVSPADYGALIAEMRIQAAQHGSKRFLVELHALSNQLNLLDVHELPDINLNLAIAPAEKTALVHAETDSLRDVDQLNYLCHRLNAAGYEAKLFIQVDAALGWLKS